MKVCKTTTLFPLCVVGAVYGDKNTENAIVVDLSKDFDVSNLDNPGAKLITEVAASVPDISAALVLERGKIVANYVRKDVDPENPLQVYSCTKSWMSLLTGIAIEAGVLSLDDTLGSVFTNKNVWTNITEADYRKNVTIYELLTMSSGLIDPGSDWWFEVPAADGGLAGGADLESSLSWPFIGPKGDYSYLAISTIMSYVLQERTNMSPREYLDAKVLSALGIDSSAYGWWKNQGGMEYSFHGMILTAKMMAKFGQLYLQRGLAAPSRQLVSSEWIDQSTRGHVKAFLDNPLDPDQVMNDILDYGYLFFIYNDTSPDNRYYCAEGGYGQDICIHPKLQRVSIQQRDGEIDPVGNLITTPVAFDESVSFSASSSAETS